MRKMQASIVPGICFFALALFAQSNRKPGLWEMTTNMTWQQSPMPPGMTMPGGGPHTTQMCLTQECSKSTARQCHKAMERMQNLERRDEEQRHDC